MYLYWIIVEFWWFRRTKKKSFVFVIVFKSLPILENDRDPLIIYPQYDFYTYTYIVPNPLRTIGV